MLVRQTRMRGVDLDLFAFDYDLTWMGFFLTPDGRTVLGRYGGRDAESAESRVSLAGLRYAMQRALDRHRKEPVPARPAAHPLGRTVDELAGARRLPATACIHCHQVHEFRREALQSAGTWTTDRLWIYPMPENVGITLDVDEGIRVKQVAPGSSAARAGVKPGDRLEKLQDRPVSSLADVQHALHQAPTKGVVALTFRRGSKEHLVKLILADGWKRTDVSWRWSLRSLDPPPWVQGDDLDERDRKPLGLSATRLALRQSAFVSETARQAGVQAGDVLVGVNGKMLDMTARQFGAYIRLTFKVGDRVTYHLLRNGKRVDVVLTLRGRR